jgi:hypothetical protein
MSSGLHRMSAGRVDPAEELGNRCVILALGPKEVTA